MKARISTEWLSGCSGCHVAVVDLHEKLLALVDEVEFVRVPVLMDETSYPEADVGVVEGAIRSDHDREAAQRMRDSCKTLVAFGTCAVYGGPSGIGWLYEPSTILRTAYQEGRSNAGDNAPAAGLPQLEDSVTPLDQVVEVDVYLPGCPPHPFFVAAGLRAALGVAAPPLTAQSVCSDCNRVMRKQSVATLQRGALTAPEAHTCFLSQGVVCLGSVALNRCHAPCPNSGVACTGCAGPALELIREPHLDLRTLVAKRLNLLTGLPREEVVAYFQESAKTFYAYAMASPVVYGKPTVEMRAWTKGPQA
jgi:F420-non-reducing hydrogenase small subunit